MGLYSIPGLIFGSQNTILWILIEKFGILVMCDLQNQNWSTNKFRPECAIYYYLYWSVDSYLKNSCEKLMWQYISNKILGFEYKPWASICYPFFTLKMLIFRIQPQGLSSILSGMKFLSKSLNIRNASSVCFSIWLYR